MDTEPKVFTRNYFSKHDIPILFTGAIFLILLIDSLVINRYLGLGTVIASLGIIMMFLIYIRIPSKIEICFDYIQYRNSTIKWEEINMVLFSVDRAGSFVDIKTIKEQITIFTRYYQHNKDLRRILEDICKERNINYTIRDKGSIS